MELNYECVRDFLLAIEKHCTLDGLQHDHVFDLAELKNYDKETVIYTAQKLNEAGYINGRFDFYYDNQMYLSISSITFNGHEFLNTIKDDKVWLETKKATSKLSSVSLPILMEVGTAYVKSYLGLS